MRNGWLGIELKRNLRIIATWMLSFLLAACLTLPPKVDPDHFDVRAREINQTSVEWIAVADPNAVCQRITPRQNYEYYACSQTTVDFARCRIYSKPDAPVSTLGHELKHCLGFTHGYPK